MSKANSTRSPWEQVFWDVALALKCLPSSVPNGNEHVIRAAKQLWIDPRRPAAPSDYVNMANICAGDSPAVVVQKLDAAFKASALPATSPADGAAVSNEEWHAVNSAIEACTYMGEQGYWDGRYAARIVQCLRKVLPVQSLDSGASTGERNG